MGTVVVLVEVLVEVLNESVIRGVTVTVHSAAYEGEDCKTDESGNTAIQQIKRYNLKANN